MRGRHLVPSLAGAAVVAATGCGAPVDRELTPPTTTTLPAKSVHTGDELTCRHGAVSARARVPARGAGVVTDADGTTASASIRLTRSRDGAVIAVCTG